MKTAIYTAWIGVGIQLGAILFLYFFANLKAIRPDWFGIGTFVCAGVAILPSVAALLLFFGGQSGSRAKITAGVILSALPFGVVAATWTVIACDKVYESLKQNPSGSFADPHLTRIARALQS